MGQDIREMFRNEAANGDQKLPNGHEKRFEARLDREMHQNRRKPLINFISIAAMIVVALGIGAFFFFNQKSDLEGSEIQISNAPVEEAGDEKRETSTYRLSDESPEFKKIEDYYMASLNIQLARLELTPENKELIDAFMIKLETLNDEYLTLNAEIKESGLNGGTVEAMIANLQLRLDLLKKLKNKLNEIEQSKNNSYENYQA
ncbi:hypothetical protein [Christiangramia aquimixticola]|uniref:hypothetical protein n=1 Tax=Christiangramia aquimixticola TaxID=1697558 RepID=UPI003AA9253C